MAGGLDSTTQISLAGVQVWDEDTKESYRHFSKSSAIRTVLCNWSDRGSLVNNLGGFAGYNAQHIYQYFLPSTYPQAPTLLFYNGVDIEGVGVRTTDTFGMVGYKYARAKIHYESLPFNPANNNGAQLQVDYSVEDIILPQPAAATLGDDGSIQVNGSSLWKFKTTGNSVNAAQIPTKKLITVTLNSLTFNLLSIPLSNLMQYAGAVNSAPFLGAAEGQVRFLGAKSSRRPNYANIESWDLTKPFVYNSIGWQNVYNPQTGLFETIVDQNGNPPFDEMDLNLIYP